MKDIEQEYVSLRPGKKSVMSILIDNSDVNNSPDRDGVNMGANAIL